MEKQSEYKVDMRETFKGYSDAREGACEARKGIALGDVAKRIGEWSYRAFDDQMCMISDQDIQDQWQHIEMSLRILRNMNIERANMEFWSRFEMVTKGMR